MLTAHQGSMMLEPVTGVIFDVCPDAVRLTGYAADELSGRCVWDLGLVERGDAYRRALQSLKPDDCLRDESVRLRRRDGRAIEVSLSARLLRVSGRDPVVHCVIRDVSAVSSTESALHERIKELDCIRRMVEILADTVRPMDDLLDEVLAALVTALRYPAAAVARIAVGRHERKTSGFDQACATLSETVAVRDCCTVSIVVGYRAACHDGDDGPFLHEERALVQLIARKVGDAWADRMLQGRFRRLIESAPNAMVLTDAAGRIDLVNARAESLFGYTRDELAGRPLTLLLPDGSDGQSGGWPASVAAPQACALGQGQSRLARRKDGSVFPVEVGLGPLDTEDGVIVSATICDISARRREEHALQRLMRVRAMTSAIHAMIVRARDRDALLDAACRIAVDVGGLRMAWIGLIEDDGACRHAASREATIAAVAQNAGAFPTDHPPGFEGVGDSLRRGAPVVVNDIAAAPGMMRSHDAAAHRGLRALASIPLRQEHALLGVFNLYASEADFFDDEEVALLREVADNIAFAMQAMTDRAQLDFLSLHDALTGLAGRALFAERLTQLLHAPREADQQLVVMVIDMRGFRTVNEALGMSAGDRVLQEIARRLVRLAGGQERVARLGGDRFAMVVPDIDGPSGLSALVEDRAQAVLEAPLVAGGMDLQPPVRIGAAVFPDDGADAEALVRNAEAALRRAKAGGQRYLFYAPHMNRAVAARLKLEHRLRRGIEQDAFRLFYQPKVDSRDRRICGAEGLLRWVGDEPLNVSGTGLIRVLEDTGLIVPLGMEMLRRAYLDRQAWCEAGLEPPPVAVNLSMLQLQQPDFIERITAALDNAHFDQAGIELELTESSLMQDVAINLPKLQRLRALGIPIAIDDFGTGYSSLSYLSTLPVTALKIDRSFVSEMLSNEGAMKIVASIISMAHSLKLRVVAEGVDRSAQLKCLRRMGCDVVQGFLFSPAVPAETFAAMLRDGVLPERDGKQSGKHGSEEDRVGRTDRG